MITIVSGLPRSGTALMMQMLQSGGMNVLTDGSHSPDEDNPQGYFNYAAVSKPKEGFAWLNQAEGMAVKVQARYLAQFPYDQSYRIIFINRDMPELIASQYAVLQHRGKKNEAVPEPQLRRQYELEIQQAHDWMEAAPNLSLLEVSYRELINYASAESERINLFLDHQLDTVKMAAAVNPRFYHHRSW